LSWVALPYAFHFVHNPSWKNLLPLLILPKLWKGDPSLIQAHEDLSLLSCTYDLPISLTHTTLVSPPSYGMEVKDDRILVVLWTREEQREWNSRYRKARSSRWSGHGRILGRGRQGSRRWSDQYHTLERICCLGSSRTCKSDSPVRHCTLVAIDPPTRREITDCSQSPRVVAPVCCPVVLMSTLGPSAPPPDHHQPSFSLQD
jgi:hypothetical protein